MSELEYRIILIGEAEVGKSNFLMKLISGKFRDNYFPTGITDLKNIRLEIYSDKKEKQVKIPFNIYLKETNGIKENCSFIARTLRKEYAFLFFYDITNRKTFNNLENYFNDIVEASEQKKICIILIGNKFDLIGKEGKKREVTEEEAKSFCEKYNLVWGGEISVKNMEQDKLKQLFEIYVKEIYNIVGEKYKPKAVKLENKPRNRISLCNPKY